jgi:hypothetical protein
MDSDRKAYILKKRDLESKMLLLEESLKDLEDWQRRHTKAFCFDCRREGIHKIRTIDGFTVRACNYHFESWVGCSCNGKIIGE